MADDFVPPGEFEEYRLVRLLGRGGMGQVFLAHDTLLDRPVAVKFIAAATPDAQQRQRFFAEARAIARLSHPNVVAVHRVGEVRRHPFLVSEFVRGQTLDTLERPVDPARVLAIALGLASGLAAAHRRGVLHRDIKPANAILTDEGDAKLLDFGLAALFELDDPVVRDRDLVGTPRYIAPEVWRGDAATPASDVYAFGVLLFELLSGRSPHITAGQGEAPRLGDLAPAVPPALARVVERCLATDPAQRYPTASALREALELTPDAASRELPAGNPYPGLATFEAAHRALFFGRDLDVRAIVDRLRADAFVLVAGDSGVGKSSLCLAGVLPALGDDWRTCRMVPGRRPLQALAAALAHAVDRDEVTLAEDLRAEPGTLAARLARSGPLLIFVDQLEELVTLAEPAEAEPFAAAWQAFAVPRPGLRLLATARGDFLARLGGPGLLRDLVGPALYVLGPLEPAGVRSAIVDPARQKGVRFETEAVVDELVAAGGAGGLPLLQFALAALWDARDEAAAVIPARALAAMGGVDGALARHADAVIARLRPAVRAAARPLLTRLVTADGTRARYRHDELVTPGDRHAQAALDALVGGRLVVVSESDDGQTGTCEIAHEALLTGWGTLRDWLAENAEARAAQGRIERVAAEWSRLGRPAELLLSPRQLGELDELEAVDDGLVLGAAQRELVAASRRARRRRRRNAGLGAAAAIATAAVAVAGLAARSRHARDAVVAERVAQAEDAAHGLDRLSTTLEAARARAFDRFEHGDSTGGEDLWQQTGELLRRRDAASLRAGAALDSALALAPRAGEVRARVADLVLDRILAVGDPDGDLVAALATVDPGGARARRLRSRVTISSDPAGAHVALARYAMEDGALRLGPPRALGSAPTEVNVDAGSYVLSFELPGRSPTRLPVRVDPGEPAAIAVELPLARAVPDGYVYVPAGRFRYGAEDDGGLRTGFLRAQPVHAATTDAYLIARHEVTFAQWIAFLDELPPAERELRRPRGNRSTLRLDLFVRDGQWHFELATTGHRYQAAAGEKVHYLQRDRRAVQDWLQFPVAGVTYGEAVEYTQWLDRTGRLPGARLCTEHEWERAARGADDRIFPGGDRTDPDDMNHDRTYGRRPLAFGPDEVGSHPASRSPFGVDDLAGNVWEWVRRTGDGPPVSRGGSWYMGEIASRATNRNELEDNLRAADYGVRVCATPRG